jgi:hypothetical protein
MLADVKFPHDERIQERRPRLCTDITDQRYTHQIPLGEIFVDDTDLFTMLPDIFNTAELLPTA